jgi:KaiC/GvpD/RAD55 family RecA-like ATPase
VLDHRVVDQISTRRLRVVKYRGSSHGTNEYPFLIDHNGIAVVPVTSLQLQHEASSERISTGLDWVDQMLDGQGFYRGSSILLTGTAGSGKTSFAAHFVDRACARGERALCFVFEESPSQYMRNMRSIGIDLNRWVKRGLLQIMAARPTLYGLEFHLASMHRAVGTFEPTVVAIDPLSSFSGGTFNEVNATLIRMIDYLKSRQITGLFTHLIPGSTPTLEAEVGVSSLMDTWILLSNAPPGDGGGRHLSIIKARGMPHAQERRGFVITDRGVATAGNAIAGDVNPRPELDQRGRCEADCRPQGAVPRMAAAIVCRRTDAAGRSGTREPEADLREAPGWPLPDRGRRSPQAAPAGERGSDCRPADAGAAVAAARQADHRRSLRHRPCAGRSRPAAANPRRKTTMKGRPRRAAPVTGKAAVRIVANRAAKSAVKQADNAVPHPARREPGSASRKKKPLAGQFVLKLYVLGTTSRSIRAINNLRRICEEHLAGRYDLEVIDIYKNVPLARGDQVIATPTLVKRLPAPFRRLIGDMSDDRKVLTGLDLQHRQQPRS